MFTLDVYLFCDSEIRTPFVSIKLVKMKRFLFFLCTNMTKYGFLDVNLKNLYRCQIFMLGI